MFTFDNSPSSSSVNTTLRDLFTSSNLSVEDFEDLVYSTIDDLYEERQNAEEAPETLDPNNLSWPQFFETLIKPYLAANYPSLTSTLTALSEDKDLYDDYIINGLDYFLEGLRVYSRATEITNKIKETPFDKSTISSLLDLLLGNGDRD